jgi:hypothetical protein
MIARIWGYDERPVMQMHMWNIFFESGAPPSNPGNHSSRVLRLIHGDIALHRPFVLDTTNGSGSFKM